MKPTDLNNHTIEKAVLLLTSYLIIPRIEILGYKIIVPTELKNRTCIWLLTSYLLPLTSYAGLAPCATRFTVPAELKYRNCICLSLRTSDFELRTSNSIFIQDIH